MALESPGALPAAVAPVSLGAPVVVAVVLVGKPVPALGPPARVVALGVVAS